MAPRKSDRLSSSKFPSTNRSSEYSCPLTVPETLITPSVGDLGVDFWSYDQRVLPIERRTTEWKLRKGKYHPHIDRFRCYFAKSTPYFMDKDHVKKLKGNGVSVMGNRTVEEVREKYSGVEARPLRITRLRNCSMLSEWEDHPGIQKIKDTIEMLLNIPMDTPVAKALSRLQFLMNKVKTLQEDGSKFSLSDQLEPLVALVCSWKKMEFDSWPALLDEV